MTTSTRFAVESQERAATAIAEGRFDRSVVPIPNADGSVALDHRRVPAARHARSTGWPSSTPSFAEMGAHVLRRLTSAVRRDVREQAYPAVEPVDHVHHAGNSSGVVDGASAVLLASPEYARRTG